MPNYDAILIPGGGLQSDGTPVAWAQNRLDRAIALYQGEFLIPLSAGTPHKPPPLDSEGYPILESVAGARYLLEHGIDARKVLVETCSFDTIGNAYFSRVMHVAPRQFRRLLTITSAFHMPRTQAVFRWVYGLPGLPGDSVLSFDAVPDTGIPSAALEARRRKESARLEALPALQSRIRNLAELHHWLFTEHTAYAAAAQPVKARGSIVDTY